MLTILFLVCVDVERLASPEWPDREEAESRLRAWLPLAIPALLDAERESESQEVRVRAAAMLGQWRGHCQDQRAEAALADPWPMDANKLWFDENLRMRIHRIARRRGVPEWEAGWLTPQAYTECGWFLSIQPVLKCSDSLADCKRRLGTSPGWPFTK